MDPRFEEYRATQECYLHYDSFRWQAGSLLAAGVFVFWGLALTGTPEDISPRSLGLLGTLVSALMSIWVLSAHHYRQIFLYKLHRIHQLEDDLKMEQHTRFRSLTSSPPVYKTYGPKGHNMDVALFAVTSLGGLFIGLVQMGPNGWLLFPVPIVVAVAFWVHANEKKVQLQLAALRKPPAQALHPTEIFSR